MTTREALRQILTADPAIEVVGLATNGEEAVALVAKLHPSIVLMDIEMPIMDGFEATKHIMREHPTPILIITSSLDPRDVAIGLQATRAGALAVSPKPMPNAPPTSEANPDRFRRTVKALADVSVVTRRWAVGERTLRRRPAGQIRCIGIAASTGGPAAVGRFLSSLPADFPVPMLIVQHIAEGFVPGLVRFLRSETSVPVRLAEDGERLVASTAYVAPDAHHLRVAQGNTIACEQDPAVNGFRPSADVLFGSLADVFGPRGAAVVLTGMGTDGLVGARRVHEAGGIVFAQDEASSVVFGMPSAVIDAGLAHLVGDVDVISAAVLEKVQRQENRGQA